MTRATPETSAPYGSAGAHRARRPLVTVRSSVPGRLRLGLPEDAWPASFASLQELVESGVATSVTGSRAADSVLLRYAPGEHTKSSFLERALAVLRRQAAAPTVPEIIPAPEPPAPAHWQITSDIPGRLRARHPYLERYAGAGQRVGIGLLQLDGVVVYTVCAATSNVLVRYDPERLSRAALLLALDEMISGVSDFDPDERLPPPFEPDTASFNMAASSSAFGLSAVALLVPALSTVAVAGTLAVSGHIFWSAGKSLFVDREIQVDIRDAVVISLSLVFGYTLASAGMVAVVDLGDVLLDSSEKASTQLLSQVFGRQVRMTRRLVDGEEVDVLVSDLEVGDVIVTETGEQIPVDGEVIDGDAMVDQHALTGEFAPVERSAGEGVFAMTVVMAGKVAVKVGKTGADTQASQIVQIIEQSVEHKVRMVTMSEQFADRMVVPTLALSGVGRVTQGPGAMLAVVNADFGTGTRIAGPLAMLTALSTAARSGIVIKNGSVLESIHLLDAIVFDKTGTLTQEVPKVGRIIASDPAFSEQQVLTYVACAEQRLSHPIARAVLARAAELGLELPAVADTDYHMGFGVDVRINGDRLKAGSRRFIEGEGIRIDHEVDRQLEAIYGRGNSATFAALNGSLIGIIELEANPRPEADRIIQHLRDRGVKKIYMISGDQELPTKALAERLVIDDYFAEVLPEEKAKYVKRLQDQGLKVGMVGDGINDSVALSQADYSISLRGGADVAADVADVVFMDGDLAKFDLLLDVSEKLRENVKRGLMLTVVPNSICIVGALAGVVGFGASLVLNNFFNTVAAFNGMMPIYALKDETERDALHPEDSSLQLDSSAQPLLAGRSREAE